MSKLRLEKWSTYISGQMSWENIVEVSLQFGYVFRSFSCRRMVEHTNQGRDRSHAAFLDLCTEDANACPGLKL